MPTRTKCAPWPWSDTTVPARPRGRGPLGSTGAIARPVPSSGARRSVTSSPRRSPASSRSALVAPHRGRRDTVHVLDTPGYATSPPDGARAVCRRAGRGCRERHRRGCRQTLDAWRAAEELGLPRVIVINKLDASARLRPRARGDPHRLRCRRRPSRVADRQERLSRRDRPLRRTRPPSYDLDAPAPRHGDEGPILRT